MKLSVLAGLLLAVSMFAADAPLMGNYAVWEMHRKGVPPEQIISAIRRSEPRFNLEPAELAKLTSNGVPQSVIDAMSARQLAPRNQLAISPRTPRERPEHWGMLPGTPEVAIGGGLSTSLLSPSSPQAMFSLEGAVGVNRYVSAMGSFNHHGGSVVAFDEFLFGGRLSASNRSRVTPFATALIGVGADRILGTYMNPDLMLGIGLGAEVNYNRNVGFRPEFRVTRGIDRDYLMRLSFGVFFRFGR